MAKKSKRAKAAVRKPAVPVRKRTKSKAGAIAPSELAVRKATTKLFLAHCTYDDTMERLRRERRSRIAKALLVRDKPKILVEGDSWFKYDCGRGVIWYLQSALGRTAEIVNLAGSTATLAGMVSFPERREFESTLRSTRDWHSVLFSGGGNDAVGRHFDEWLLPDTDQAAPKDVIDLEAWSTKKAAMRVHFVMLAELVASATPAPLYINAYDFANPNGKGILGRSWLAPAFRKKGYGARPLAFKADVVRLLLEDFARLIADVGRQCSNVRLLPTQGTLQPAEWANELHPDARGFRKIAEKVQKAIKL